MRLILNKIRLNQEFNQLQILHLLIGIFSFLGLFIEIIGEMKFFIFIPLLLLLALIFFISKKTQEKLYYSYWTFIGLLGIFLFSRILLATDNSASLSYGLSIVFILIEIYILSSPIYYPRVSWWEYDFRYRDDLKINVKYKDKNYRGRLTDLRREAGCIAMFEDVEVGEEVEIVPFNELKSFTFKVELVSKRRYSLGRPYQYGVKFELDSSDSKNLYDSFVKFWKDERVGKLKKKFQNV